MPNHALQRTRSAKLHHEDTHTNPRNTGTAGHDWFLRLWVYGELRISRGRQAIAVADRLRGAWACLSQWSSDAAAPSTSQQQPK